MSDNDPRLTPLRVALEDSVRLGRIHLVIPAHYGGAQGVLRAIDAADRAEGIVRVDTRDEALVERIARARWLDRWPTGLWIPDRDMSQRALMSEVRLVLTAIREAIQ